MEKMELVGDLNPSEKYAKVSWDYDIPLIWKNKIHVPNHRPGNHCGIILRKLRDNNETAMGSLLDHY